MEINVWIQWFVRVVGNVLSQFASLSNPQSPSNGGASQSAQGSAVGSTSTSTSVKSLLRVVRNPAMETADGLFGDLIFDGKRICFTMENRALAIPEGTYSLEITYSPHFGKEMPLLDGVPGRTEIRLHPANWPTQLEGCVSVGQSIDGDSLSTSELAFEKVFTIIKNGIASGGIAIQIVNG